MSWDMKDLTADDSDILDQLTAGCSKIPDGVQWSRTSIHPYREDLFCVPKTTKKSCWNGNIKQMVTLGWREFYGSSISLFLR